MKKILGLFVLTFLAFVLTGCKTKVNLSNYKKIENTTEAKAQLEKLSKIKENLHTKANYSFNFKITTETGELSSGRKTTIKSTVNGRITYEYSDTTNTRDVVLASAKFISETQIETLGKVKTSLDLHADSEYIYFDSKIQTESDKPKTFKYKFNHKNDAIFKGFNLFTKEPRDFLFFDKFLKTMPNNFFDLGLEDQEIYMRGESDTVIAFRDGEKENEGIFLFFKNGVFEKMVINLTVSTKIPSSKVTIEGEVSKTIFRAKSISEKAKTSYEEKDVLDLLR